MLSFDWTIRIVNSSAASTNICPIVALVAPKVIGVSLPTQNKELTYAA